MEEAGGRLRAMEEGGEWSAMREVQAMEERIGKTAPP